jgi:hypothetical protein
MNGHIPEVTGALGNRLIENRQLVLVVKDLVRKRNSKPSIFVKGLVPHKFLPLTSIQ